MRDVTEKENPFRIYARREELKATLFFIFFA